MFGKNLPFIGITLVVAIVLFIVGRTTSDKNPNNPSDAKEIRLRESSSTSLSSQTLNPDPSADWKSLSADKDQIQTLSSSAQFLALKEKLRAWAQEDPLAALAFAKEQVEPASEVRYLVFAILNVWTYNDPLAAWDWGEKDSDFNLYGMLNVMGEIAPELAWEKAAVFAEKEEFANLKTTGYISAIDGMLRIGKHAEAIELFENSEIASIVDNPEDRFYFLQTILTDWTLYAPEEAFAWANSLTEESATDKAIALKSVIDNWAYADPEQVLALANETTDPALAEKAISAGLFRLSEHQPEKAITWLAQKEPQPAFDDAYESLAMNTNLLRENPEQSISLMASISNPDESSEGIVAVGEEWFQQDPVAADQFFKEHTNLSEADRRAIAKQARFNKKDITKKRVYNGWD